MQKTKFSKQGSEKTRTAARRKSRDLGGKGESGGNIKPCGIGGKGGFGGDGCNIKPCSFRGIGRIGDAVSKVNLQGMAVRAELVAMAAT